MAAATTWRTPGRVSGPMRYSNPGVVMARITGVHLGAQAAGAHQDQPLGALGELVGELHRHPAAEGVPDHVHLVDAEHGEQVAHAVGVPAEL